MASMRKAGAALVLAGASAACAPTTNIMDPAGPVMAAERAILVNASVIMLAIIVPTIILALAAAWWFRADNPRAKYRPEFVHSGRIEAVIWSIPLLTILFLGGVAYIGSHQLDPARPLESNQRPLRVQVVALDWKWLFIYPEQGIATINYLVMPANRPVSFEITSSTVMNTFWIPRLGSMIYAMSGMSSPLNLMADREGRFDGLSGHLSGDGFPSMYFRADAVAPARFEAWVGETRGRGAALDRAVYMQLQRQSIVRNPGSYARVTPGLYEAIVTQAIPPGPGPETGRGGRPDIMPRGGYRYAG